MAKFDPTGYLSVAGFDTAASASTTIGLIIAGAKLLKPVLMPALQQLQAQGQQLIDEGISELNRERQVKSHGVKSIVQTDENPQRADVGEPIDIDHIPHGGYVVTPEN